MGLDLTVVIPARDAAGTLADTLDSLRDQTEPDWKAIVVDDGSTDATADIVRSFARADSRIELVRIEHGGVSAARNAGIERAGTDWLLFLDADDLITRDCLEKFRGAAEASPDAEWIVGGWAHLIGDDRVMTRLPNPDLLRGWLASHCPICIHSCLVRRSLVLEIGGFDSNLIACEDWDLWVRCARSRAAVAAVEAVVALYRMRRGQASRVAEQVLADGIVVLERAAAPDPRIARPRPELAQGIAPDELPARRLAFAAWAAGLAVGRGEDVDALLDAAGVDGSADVGTDQVAHSLYEAPLLALGVTPAAWGRLWPRLRTAVESAIGSIERRAGGPPFGARVRRTLERLIVAGTDERPLTIGSTHAIAVDVERPLSDLEVPDDVVAVRCDALAAGERVGSVDLPTADGMLSGWVLEDAIAAQLGWLLVERFLDATVEPRRRRRYDGWTVFLQELWGGCALDRDGFHAGDAARSRLRRIVHAFRVVARRAGATLRARGARGWLIAEVSRPLPAPPFTRESLDIVVAIGGVPVGTVRLRPSFRGHTAQLQAAINGALGAELAFAAAREGLLGVPLDDPMPFRARLANRAGPISVASLADGEFEFGPGSAEVARDAGTIASVVLGRRQGAVARSSCSRRALLPAQTKELLVGAAAAAGEPVLELADGSPGRVVYAPSLLWRDSRSARSSRSKHMAGLGTHESDRTESLPVLMYHRIAEHRSDSLDRYAVTPRAFAAQLEHLARAGFTSVSLNEWFEALADRVPLPGRRIALTFDDGYADFLTDAWPLLERFGFAATLFVVTDRVGKDNAWDHKSGCSDPVPLLAWDELADLHRRGLELGGHTRSHRHLTALRPAEVVEEAAGCRAEIAERLGRAPRAFAYPYGDVDAITRHLVGASGFELGLTCSPGRSGLWEDPLDVSRIEVSGHDDIAAFAAKLECAEA